MYYALVRLCSDFFFSFAAFLFYTFETGSAYGRVLSYKIGTDGRCGFVLHLWDGVLFYRLRFGRRPASAWSISFPVHLRSPTLFIRSISIKKTSHSFICGHIFGRVPSSTVERYLCTFVRGYPAWYHVSRNGIFRGSYG